MDIRESVFNPGETEPEKTRIISTNQLLSMRYDFEMGLLKCATFENLQGIVVKYEIVEE